MNNWRRNCRWFVAACGLGLNTALWAQTDVSTETPPASKEVAESATLVVMNISGPTLVSNNQDITDNGSEIASLPRLTYKTLPIGAGHHEFRFKAFPQGKRVATLEAESGKTYYLEVGYSPGRSWAFPFAGDPMTIKIIGQDEAFALMKEMKPSQPETAP
ncbi:hypothetical protein NH8B_2730 [Pseudogulbenkiania sp. NH8B]|uniref:hypothetical protein n=1 Tax=Pseudogulbenkiania sp. (strain NH8B) TaxID=748280 RepID=UPI0002279B68|nr:hypothetical protein [Pseudogulbenkiania sp. NH8B]BAK77528.1 hypothetical protein NH8B_2730 [Pseudogulbenkiania sp. NH8B]